MAALIVAGFTARLQKTEHSAAETASALQRYYPSAAAKHAPQTVETKFPARFDDTLTVSAGGAQVSVRPLDAQTSQATQAPDGSLIYANGFDSCDVSYRSMPGKTEEFMYVRRPVDSSSWSWELSIGDLRPLVQSNGAVAFVDAHNMPRMQISAPEGKDAKGRVLRCGDRLNVNLEPMLNGRARLTLSADLRGLDFPVAIDPSWSSVNPMGTARADHTATLLPNGKILVAGGMNSSTLNTAEVFDPSTGNWTPTANNMSSPRSGHVAVLMGNGLVLLAGGTNGSSLLLSADLYNPATNTFTPTGSMGTARTNARAVLLATPAVNPDVLVMGGELAPAGTSERYNETTGTWSVSGSMNTARQQFTATLLSTNNVLIAGGTDVSANNVFYTSAELYDPTANSGVGSFIALSAQMITGRFRHQAVVVNGGANVLMIGGFNNGLFPSTELYSVAGNTFLPTGSMTKARTEHRIGMLSNGKVLAVGCHDGSFAQVDLYDPVSGGTWGLTGSTLTPHTRHQLTSLADGRILVTGGFVGGFSSAVEIYDPKSEPVSTPIAANASNPLAITLQSVTIDDAGVTFPGASITNPTHGVISGTAPNLVYTSTPGYSGPDSFTFKSQDTFGLSKTGTISITVNSLVPTISFTSPDAAIAGSAGAFMLTVNGTNFVTSSKVNWNGSVRPTTFVSTTQLTATISASDVATAGTANVTVVNTAPGGGTSIAQPFTILGGALGQWIVTTTADSGAGSLRMALNDARSGDSILFDTTVFNLVNSNAATVINVLSQLPDMNKGNVTIDASNVRVTVNGSGAGSANGLQLVSNSNTVQGLTLVGFTKDGIYVTGNSNIIGGSRALPAAGTGPNGQGLRIAGNGAFGIEVAGGSSNIVKGCWIGLDASGSSSQPNLAGILIQQSGSNNQVGSTLADEANVISGNLYEGVTVSGAGTNNNLVMGNIVGASALITAGRSINVGTRDSGDLSDTLGGRSSAGNGSAGIFLSKGTNGTQVGGDTGQGNAIGYNGGNGVEVRATTSKFNSSKHNGISSNKKGGIALFDGSNNGIKPPIFDLVYRTGTGGRATGDSVGIHVEGHAAVDGAVEVFNDLEDQGGSLLGRSSCIGGIWKIDTTSSASMNLTATLTDTAGNTSTFSLFGPAPAFPTPVITSPLTVSAIAGISFAYTITATGTQPITFQAANLPDGLTLNGNLISGTPTTAGTYMVHITATNSAGTVSSTLVIAVVSSFTMDSDGDGVPDFLETLAGTDPNDATSAPVNSPLSVDKAQIKVVPTGSGDFIAVTLRFTLPSGTPALGGTATVQIGNVIKSNLTFGGPTKAPRSSTTLVVKTSTKGSSSVVVTFGVRGENLKAGLTTFGLTDITTPATGTSVTLPMAVALKTTTATYVAGSVVKLNYKSKKGKGGTAKK